MATKSACTELIQNWAKFTNDQSEIQIWVCTFLRIVCICSVFNKEFEIIAFITETRDDI